MSLGKFLDLIQRSALYFARPNMLGDEWEGAKSQLTIVDEFMDFMDQLGGSAKVSKEQLIEFYKASDRRWNSHQKMNWTTGVNCWHMAEGESVAMWRVYCQRGEGIAVKSTFARLRDSFSASPRPDVFIGGITYNDYATESVPFRFHYEPLLRKRPPFAFERELRAMCIPYGSFEEIPDPPPTGWHVNVDLRTLIDAIYVAPEPSGWLTTVVQSAMDRYDLAQVPVIRSVIAQKPPP